VTQLWTIGQEVVYVVAQSLNCRLAGSTSIFVFGTGAPKYSIAPTSGDGSYWGGNL